MRGASSRGQRASVPDGRRETRSETASSQNAHLSRGVCACKLRPLDASTLSREGLFVFARPAATHAQARAHMHTCHNHALDGDARTGEGAAGGSVCLYSRMQAVLGRDRRVGTFLGDLFPARRCTSGDLPGARLGGATIAKVEPARPTATSAHRAAERNIEM